MIPFSSSTYPRSLHTNDYFERCYQLLLERPLDPANFEPVR
jgi:hypothetical protein